MKFKIGDRVECIKVHDYGPNVGEKGEIKKIPSSGMFNPGVRFDNSFDSGHSLEGDCKDGHGWFLPEDNLKLIVQVKFFKGNEKKIKIKKIVKEIESDKHFLSAFKNKAEILPDVSKWSDEQLFKWKSKVD